MNVALPCPSGRCYNGSYWRAWLFQDLCPLGATNGNRCTQRGKESNCYWSFVPLWYRRWRVSVSLPQVVTWIQEAADADAIQHPQGRVAKTWWHLGWEGCIVTNFLTRGIAVSCRCLPSFRWSYKKNVNIFALQWPFHAAYASMDTIQAITKFGQSVLLFPHYSPDLTPWDCKLFGCVKTSCEVHMKKTMCFGCIRRRASFNTHTHTKQPHHTM